MKHFERTWHLKTDLQPWIDIINENEDKFFCPFSNVESYLNIYKGRKCEVQFFNLLHCDYSGPTNSSAKKYIRYLSSVERKLGNEDTHNFLTTNTDKFLAELNEENFNIPHEDPKIAKLVRDLDSMWHFDGRTKAGHISRARIVRLPAGGTMPYHRDETEDKNLRVICPLITNDDVLNGFKDGDGEHLYHMPATGHFYTFEEVKYEHGVFNNSDSDRYALIFTVNDVNDMKQWDREYKKNKMFWEAWSRGP